MPNNTAPGDSFGVYFRSGVHSFFYERVKRDRTKVTEAFLLLMPHFKTCVSVGWFDFCGVHFAATSK